MPNTRRNDQKVAFFHPDPDPLTFSVANVEESGTIGEKPVGWFWVTVFHRKQGKLIWKFKFRDIIEISFNISLMFQKNVNVFKNNPHVFFIFLHFFASGQIQFLKNQTTFQCKPFVFFLIFQLNLIWIYCDWYFKRPKFTFITITPSSLSSLAPISTFGRCLLRLVGFWIRFASNHASATIL